MEGASLVLLYYESISGTQLDRQMGRKLADCLQYGGLLSAGLERHDALLARHDPVDMHHGIQLEDE